MAAAPCSFLSISNSHSSPKLLHSSSSLYPYVSLRRRGLMRSKTTPPHFLILHTSNNKSNTSPPAATASSSVILADAIPEQQNTDATYTIISALLFIAFVGLSILTIGVIYIAVTDFLQKREGEKFQKEQAEKNKKSGGKKKLMKARAGPKGFGQKIVEVDDDDI